MSFGSNRSVRVGTDAEAGQLRIGVSDLAGGSATGTNPVDGTLNMGCGSSLTVGTAGQGAEMTIGWSLGVRGTTVDREGDLLATGGAQVERAVGNEDPAALERGILRANGQRRQISGEGSATMTTFDVSGNVAIGHSTVADAQNSRGDVYLSQVAGSIGGTLAAGDTDAGSSGLLELHGTHLDVAGDVNIYDSGEINVLAPDVKLTWDDTTYLSTAFSGAANIFYDAGTDATYAGCPAPVESGISVGMG